MLLVECSYHDYIYMHDIMSVYTEDSMVSHAGTVDIGLEVHQVACKLAGGGCDCDTVRLHTDIMTAAACSAKH